MEGLIILSSLLVLETSAMLIKDACGGGELTSFAGEIMSPNYPDDYPHTTGGGCYWTINRGNTDSVIRVTIRDLDLSGPDYTYGELLIRDGPDGYSPLLGYYYYGSPDYGSGVATPITLVTSGPTAYIYFLSYNDVTGHRGFDLAYTTETSAMLIKDACGGGELTSFAGEIMSPNYPDYYPHTTGGGCYWTINRGNTDSVIRVTIRDLDLSGPDYTYGELLIWDGPNKYSPLLGWYYYGSSDYGSGVATPITLVTSGPTAYIEFYSSYDVTGHRGFDLAYTTATAHQ